MTNDEKALEICKRMATLSTEIDSRIKEAKRTKDESKLHYLYGEISKRRVEKSRLSEQLDEL